MKQTLLFLFTINVILVSYRPCLSSSPTKLIYPGNIVYEGAFKVPRNTAGGEYGWEYGMKAMTYSPKGDAKGLEEPNDKYPGSLFGSNHRYENFIGEMNIPDPVKSKNLNDLNTATMLQNFSDINRGLFTQPNPQIEVLYLSQQGDQTSDKLHIVWKDWYNVGDNDRDRYAWCETDLSNFTTQGTWNLGRINPHLTGDFLFEIPEAWADMYTPGKRILTGSYHKGGSMDGGNRFGGGPGMFAYGPWNDGNPPPRDATLDVTTLVNYEDGHLWYCQNDSVKVKDEWDGGAWITAGGMSAIVLTGRKGLGEEFYGINPNGCSDKGYHSLGGYKPYMLFYNPDDLAAVATGAKRPYEPMPYATLDCGEFAFVPYDVCEGGFGSAGYDRENNLLYVAECFVDGARPVIHVFRIDTKTSNSLRPTEKLNNKRVSLNISPNPFKRVTKITLGQSFGSSDNGKDNSLKIFNCNGALVEEFKQKQTNSSEYIFTWDARNQPRGMYIIHATIGDKILNQQAILF